MALMYQGNENGNNAREHISSNEAPYLDALHFSENGLQAQNTPIKTNFIRKIKRATSPSVKKAKMSLNTNEIYNNVNMLSEVVVKEEPVFETNYDDIEFLDENSPQTSLLERFPPGDASSFLGDSFNGDFPHAESLNDDTFTPPAPKKRGRPRKNGQEGCSSSTPTTTPKVARSRTYEKGKISGDRKSIRNPSLAFNPRLLLITSRSQLETDEVLEQPSGEGPIQCGLCLAYTTEDKWNAHIGEHYGVGWKVGETPQDVTKKATIISSAANYIKNFEFVVCRICKRAYRSGIGMERHLEVCGAEKIQVTCEICSKRFQYSTISAHKVSCIEKAHKIIEEKEYMANLEQSESGRVKRATRVKAEIKLKDMGEHLNQWNSALIISRNFKYKRFLPLELLRNKWLYQMAKKNKASCLFSNCSFESEYLPELELHAQACPMRIPKTGFYCLLCQGDRCFVHVKEAEIHYANEHAQNIVKKKENDDYQAEQYGDSSENDYPSDSDDEFAQFKTVAKKKAPPRKKKTANDPNSLEKNETAANPAPKTTVVKRLKPLYQPRTRFLTKNTFPKWQNFVDQFFSNEPLFNWALPNYELYEKDTESLLPPWESSMRIHYRSKNKMFHVLGEPEDLEWFRVKRFTSFNTKQDNLTYIGGPIKNVKWIPLPNHLDIKDQFFIVNYRKDIEAYSKFKDPNHYEDALLIFKVIQKFPSEENFVSLQYALLVEDGPILCFDLLPSGGYDPDTNQMGVVAVGTAHGLKIYSLPLEVHKPCIKREDGGLDIAFIKVKPCMALLLKEDKPNDPNKIDHLFFSFQCIQMCWSLTKPHNVIVGALENGCLAIWDIDIDSEENFNHAVQNNMHVFYPSSLFYVGEKAPRVIALHYDSNGPRWLLSVCASRKSLILDIRDLTCPFIVKSEPTKNVIYSIYWSPIWESYIFGNSDVLSSYAKCAAAISPLGLAFPSKKLENTLCGVNKVDYSELLNLESYATDNGDIIVGVSREMNLDFALSKNYHLGRAIWSLDIKTLDGSPLPIYKQDPPSNNLKHFEQEFMDKYGIVFSPASKLTKDKRDLWFQESRIPHYDLARYMRATDICYNKNMSGKKLILVGYANGFIRLLKFQQNKFFTAKERNE